MHLRFRSIPFRLTTPQKKDFIFFEKSLFYKQKITNFVPETEKVKLVRFLCMDFLGVARLPGINNLYTKKNKDK